MVLMSRIARLRAQVVVMVAILA